MTVYILDIETIPDPDKMGEPPEDWLMKGVASHWKDETVANHRQKQHETWPEQFAKIASLDPRLGMLCAAGLLVEGSQTNLHLAVMGSNSIEAQHLKQKLTAALPEEISVFSEPVDTEASLMEWLKDMLGYQGERPRFAGFNLRNFDLPWIKYRAMVHGVTLPKWAASRYDPSSLTDWQDVLANYGSLPIAGWSLDRYAATLDLEFKPWEDGSKIMEWMAKKEYGKVGYHCAFDVLTTWALDKKARVGYV